MTDTDSDDDYELPSLAQRIQASYQLQSKSRNKILSSSEDEDSKLLAVPKDIPCISKSPIRRVVIDTSSSENEDSKFLKFSEKIRTPCPPVKTAVIDTSSSENDDSKFLKFSQKISTPCPSVKIVVKEASTSENEDSKFLKFSEKISTPCPSVKNSQIIFSDSDSDEVFSNFIEKFRDLHTPKSQNKINASAVPVHVPEEKRLLNTSASFSKKNSIAEVSERVCSTPGSAIKLKSIKLSESEDENIEFLKFSEKIGCTPCSAMKKSQIIFSDSDSDEVFSNFIDKFRDLHTPKSQNKINTSAVPVHVSEEKRLLNTSASFSKKNSITEGTPKVMTPAQLQNEKEYATLFPFKSDDSLFYKKRVFYAEKLYRFFNRKVFDSQLPNDMPLTWDGSMVKTAGLTICKRSNNEYSCSIKLSSKLLTSFDRLQDTLLHEMCHAAVWMLNKVNVSHGPIWKIWASRCKLILPFIECPERCHTYDVPYRFYYQCTTCGWKRGACKRIRKYHGAVCKTCKTAISMTK